MWMSLVILLNLSISASLLLCCDIVVSKFKKMATAHLVLYLREFQVIRKTSSIKAHSIRILI